MNKPFENHTEERPFEFPAAPVPASGNSSASELDLLKLVLRYKWLLALGVIAGLALGHLGYLKMGPEYESTAKILVSVKAEIPMREGSSKRAYVGERGQHIALIMSPMIAEKAIKLHDLKKLPSFANAPDPVDEVLDGLKVQRSAGTDYNVLNVLDISYRNKNKRDADAVVAAIIDAYQSYLKEKYAENANKMLVLVSEANDDILKQLEEKRAEHLKFRKDAPLLWKQPSGTESYGSAAINVHQKTVEAVEKEIDANVMQQDDVIAEQRTMQDLIDSGKSRESLEMLIRMSMAASAKPGTTAASVGSGSSGLDDQLLQQLLQEKKLLRDFGDDHPDVKTLRQNIETIKQLYRDRGFTIPGIVANANDRRQGNVAVQSGRIDHVEVYMDFLQQQLNKLKERHRHLSVRHANETKLAKGFASFFVKDQIFNEEIVLIKSLYNSVLNRMKTEKLSRNNGGYELEQIAPVRNQLSFKRQLKFWGAGAVFGIGLAVAFIYLKELQDTTIKSLAEIRRRLQLPVLGGIPEFTDATLKAAVANGPSQYLPALCYFHRPGSMEAEAYRSVRTALFVTAGNAQHRVIQVTSPEPGDGKTTIAANLAVAMAQSGKSVLLIDADMRKPTVHRLFGVPREVGTSEVLGGEIQFVNAIKESGIQNLSVLTAGDAPANPAELLSLPTFAAVVEEAKREFDFVLVDTPPLLVVTDPCIVAPRTDALVLVVRVGKNRRAAALRATELLNQHEADVIGVIANSVPTRTDEGYGYSYGKSYGEYYRTDEPSLAKKPNEADQNEFVPA